MNVGIWIGPAVLVGLFGFLWFASWLEGLIVPPGLEPDWPIRKSIGDPRAGVVPQSDAVGAGRRPAGRIEHVPAA